MLLDRIQKKLERDEKLAREAYERREQDYKNRLAEWLAEGGSRDRLVKILRDTASAAAHGTPVPIPEELREFYHGSRSLWFRGEIPTYSHTPNRTLTSLRELLEITEDEKVSSTFLRDSGFRNLNGLFS